MEASPKPAEGEGRPDLYVVPEAEHLDHIPLTKEGFLSLDAPDRRWGLAEGYVESAEWMAETGKAILGDVRKVGRELIRHRNLEALGAPVREEIEAFERVHERILDAMETVPVTFRPERGEDVTVRTLYRRGEAHPEKVFVVMNGLGGHPVNAVKQVESQTLRDYSFLLVPRPACDKSNRELVWHPGYSLEEHIENSVRNYAAAIDHAAQELGAREFVLVGHSLGGPYSLLALERLREEYPDRYAAINAVIPEQTSGFDNMAKYSGFDGRVMNAERMRALEQGVHRIITGYGRLSRAVDGHLKHSGVKRAARSVSAQQVFRSVVSARSARLKVGDERVMDQEAIQASICSVKKQDAYALAWDLKSVLHMHDRSTMYDHELPVLNVWGMRDRLLAAEASGELVDKLREDRRANHDLVGDVAFPKGFHFVKAERFHAEPVSQLYRLMMERPTETVRALHQDNADPEHHTPTWYYRADSVE